jgi:dTDP-D-glucose 4,6-dehydratase
MKGFKYSIISGEKTLSPNNNEEIEALTHNNENGQSIKVVMISQAGSEGIDLKNIRQVHIMEPWYNMNRIEQIIGRARRNCSHMELPLEKRNVQVFLHATILPDDVESMDMYLYRLSEKKSINIGKITRLLKSISVDCLLNKEQQQFSKINQKVKLLLSSENTTINYNINDEPHTSLCDYNNSCEFECINKINEEKDNLDISTYSYQYTKSNKIKDKIKELYKIKHVYKKKQIFTLIKNKNINNEEIERALHDLEKDILIDMFGRKGYLVNILDLCVEKNIKNLFLASSSEVYQYPNKFPTPENIPLVVPDIKNPRFSYGGGKILTELMGYHYGKKFFKKLVIFRPHNVYGHDMGNEHVIPEFIERIKSKTNVFKIKGTGNETRSFIYITDFVKAFDIILRKGKHCEIYNIGTEEEINIKTLAKKIAKIYKKKIFIKKMSLAKGGTQRRCPDISKIKKLGFVQKISLENGIKLILSQNKR